MSEQNKDQDLDQKLEQAMIEYDQAVQAGVITKEDERQERIRSRLMRSSTFKAIAALEESKPEDWEPEYLEEVIENVDAIDRVRWAERGTWIGAVIGISVGAFLFGWNMKPVPEPEPVQWECTVQFQGETRDAVACEGVSEG